MLNNLLICLSKLDKVNYRFIEYLIQNCQDDGFFVFDNNKQYFIFGLEDEVKNHVILKIFNDLFLNPLTFRKGGDAAVFRIFSYNHVDVTSSLKVQLSQVFVDNLYNLRDAINSNLIHNLRLLNCEIAMSLYLHAKGTANYSEQDIRRMVFDNQTTRFSNIVERKLKPALVLISKKLGKSTYYFRNKINGVSIICVSIT
jgi:hypothetical protein